MKVGLTSPQVSKVIRSARMEATREVVMSTAMKFATLVLAFATVCPAQDGLTVRNTGHQKWSAAEARKICISAWSIVQQEFGRTLPIAPRVNLVLGADRNEVWLPGREIRLTKWNRDAFAQGVVWLAFENLMTSQQRLSIARRAVNSADATVEVEELKK